jgi:AraC-like DNA-binding protein
MDPMTVVIKTDHLPPVERFTHLREMALRLPEPVEFHSPSTADFPADTAFRKIGQVTATRFTTTGPVSARVLRSPKLIKRSDPEHYRFLLSGGGQVGIGQYGRSLALANGEMGLYDTSYPNDGWWRSSGGRARLFIVGCPRSLLPFPRKRIEGLLGCGLPTRQGIGRLVATTVARMSMDAAEYPPASRLRLSTVVGDLLAVLLGELLEEERKVTPESRHQALFARILDFVERRLGDPALSPGTISAAHHISTRTLHRLFQREGRTVAAWIRDRRLDRCRHDLADPRLATRPVHMVARHWGFTDAAHFTRAFQHAYGRTPTEFRNAQGQGVTPPRGQPWRA